MRARSLLAGGALLVVLFAGCGDDDEGSTVDESGSPQTTESTEGTETNDSSAEATTAPSAEGEALDILVTNDTATPPTGSTPSSRR
jgi:hypothetical protein